LTLRIIIASGSPWRGSLKVLAAAVCWPLFAPSCVAAPAYVPMSRGPVVQVSAGEVLVNSGQGFRAIGTGTPLEPGCQLLASPNSSVTLVYPDGTLVPVQPGAITFVTDIAERMSVPPVAVSPVTGAPLAGATVWETSVVEGSEDVGALGASSSGLAGTVGGIPSGTILAVAGIGAAAAGAVAIASGGSSSPASP